MPQATMPQPSTGLGAPAPAQAGSEFAPLLRTVKGQGLLDRRTGWYATRIAVNLLALAGTVAAMVFTGDTWWTLLLALPLSVFWARGAFI
ncbi:acyl-CoA desaturase, partial [Streptomyces sp. SID1034]|nr:acyl-CoA desaturase [Streptomyces sp. SID1034]